jgi:hypothetical protein
MAKRAQKPRRPEVGDIVEVYGADCKIIRVYDHGTIDVERLSDGRCWRVTGLWF